MKLNVVHNDSVSSPKRDRTDWKYIVLPKPGKLTVQLHWDSGRAQLNLAVFDVLGVKIQDGRPWGADGRRAVVAVEETGRYYIQVQAVSKRDESNYSLRLRFKPDQTGCIGCTPGDRKCLGSDGFITCAQISPGCTRWTKAVACPRGNQCQAGICGAAVATQCSVGQRRCVDGKAYMTCTSSAVGTAWGKPRRCSNGKRCRGGHCRRVKKSTPAKPLPKVKCTAKIKIISIYRYRGRMTLHLDIGSNKVKPGQLGHVLQGQSGGRLPGGQVKIIKVTGRFAIATTSLQKLGNNRWVVVRVC